MAIMYRTAKFKFANILAIVILGSTAKFNSRQYFWLYGIKYMDDTSMMLHTHHILYLFNKHIHPYSGRGTLAMLHMLR